MKKKQSIPKHSGRSVFLVEHPIGLDLEACTSREDAEKKIYGKCKTEGCRIVQFREVEKRGKKK